MERRWGRGKFLLAWLALSAGQVAVVVLAGFELSPVHWAILAGLQVAKCVPAAYRLVGMGRAAEESLWSIIPLFNFALWFQLIRRGPSAKRVEQRLTALRQQTSATAALGEGFQRMMRQPLRVAFAVFGLALPYTLLMHEAVYPLLLDSAPSYQAERLQTVQELAGTFRLLFYGLTLALLGVGVTSLLSMGSDKAGGRSRGRTARRLVVVGWFASLLLFGGFALLRLQLSGEMVNSAQLTAILPMLTSTLVLSGITFFYVSFVGAGALALLASTLLGEPLSSPNNGEKSSGIWSRWLSVAAVAGVRNLAVSVGFQALILPGVWFAVSFIFPEMVLLRSAKGAPFKLSRSLVSGIRSKIMLLLAITTVLAFVLVPALVTGAGLWGDLSGRLMSTVGLQGPSASLLEESFVVALSENVLILLTWVLQFTAVGILFDERLQRYEKKQERAAAQ